MFQAGAVKVQHDLLLVVLQVNQSNITTKIHAKKDDVSPGASVVTSFVTSVVISSNMSNSSWRNAFW